MSSKRKSARDYIAQVLNGKSCYFCSESHAEALEFHHVTPSQKKFTISQAVARGYDIEDIKKELNKTIIICSNCHKKLEYLITKSKN